MGTGSIEPTHPRMGMSFALAEQYGEAVGVGGSTNMYSGSITLSPGAELGNFNVSSPVELASGKGT